MRTVARDILIGSTAVLGLAGLAAMLLMFGELSFVRTPTYAVTLKLDSAGGLGRTSAVRLNGVRIGMISSITNTPDPRDGVVIGLAVDEGVRIPRDVKIGFDRGLVGESSLALTIPRERPTPDPGFIEPGGTIEGSGMGPLDTIAAMIDERLKSIGDAAASFKAVCETYERVGRRAEELLAPRTIAEVEGGQPANLTSALARFDAAISDARKWLGDESLRTDAATAVKRAAEVFDKAGEAVGAWTRAATDISGEGKRIADTMENAGRDFAALTRGIGEVLNEVHAITGRINAGEGTIGQLVSNPDLYRSLNDAAKRLEKALTEAQLLIEKYRTEGIPIQW
ncbi:MAG TPA: MlaD family protein [Phycisphaerales bacterium]|nr:MlaD family protein [Phycisphaerales bacterium]